MKNKLYYGDNLEVLRNHIANESIDLCYIDPPFNSNRDYNQIYTVNSKVDKAQAQAFIDTWTWDKNAELGYLEILENKIGLPRQSVKLIKGVPKDIESAIALAHKEGDRVRKEFEKWIVLTYAENKARINDKKSADAGIDGIAFMLDKKENGDITNAEIIFSVKSGESLSATVIRDLFGTVE